MGFEYHRRDVKLDFDALQRSFYGAGPLPREYNSPGRYW